MGYSPKQMEMVSRWSMEGGLLNEVRSLDDQVWSTMYEEFAPILKDYVTSVLGDADTDAIVQDVFYSTWREICSGLGPRDDLYGYLFVTAASKICDVGRHDRTLTATSELDFADVELAVELGDMISLRDSAVSPHEKYEQDELVNSVYQAADQYLTDHERAVLLMDAVEDMSQAEIAVQLNTNANNVKQLNFRAKSKLRTFSRE